MQQILVQSALLNWPAAHERLSEGNSLKSTLHSRRLSAFLSADHGRSLLTGCFYATRLEIILLPSYSIEASLGRSYIIPT